MRSIKLFVIFTVTALDLAIVAWGIRTDELVANAKLFQLQLKKRGFVGGFRQEAVSKLGAVVCLDTFNEIWEFFTTWRRKTVEE